MKLRPCRIPAIAAFALVCAAASANPVERYLDPLAPLEARADDLVGRMTLEEKALQLLNSAPAIERLGIPPYDYWNEALHGVARAGEATVFPQAIAMAATWDKELLHAEGRVIAREGRARYHQAQRENNYARYYGLTFWSPNINIFRDPRWGRGQETLGEDPYLTGVLASGFIEGIQGKDPKYFEAIATPKHLAVHSGPEPLRHGFDVSPSRRDLAETYLPAFRRAIVDAKAYSLMCAYNAVDGKPACASPELLEQTLRRDWGFTGFVTSDCAAIDDIAKGHHYAKDLAEAAALAVRAGTDTICGGTPEVAGLPSAVKQGLITEAEIDTAVKRLFIARMRLGMFDPPAQVPFAAIPYSENHSQANRDLALRAAREAIVLLKNDGTLPLVSTDRKIAVIGPGATSLIALEGNYMGTPVDAALPLDAMLQTFGADQVRFAQGAPYVEGLAVPVPRTALGGGLTATFYNGTEWQGEPVATRIDHEIEHNWDAVAAVPGLDRKAYSVRWTGHITPPAAGDYYFSFDGGHCRGKNDYASYRLRIDGAEPVDVSPACVGAASVKLHFSDTRPRAITVEHSMRSQYAEQADRLSLSWRPPLQALLAQAVQAASDADVVVAVVGLNAWLEGEEMSLKLPGFNGGDRTDIGLPKAQADLLDALFKTGKPVIVVVQSGSAIALGAAKDRARAVLHAWYGGEVGGRAIAEVLSGAVNPSGRLPVTFYASSADLPAFTDYSMQGRTYRYFAGQPDYAFGHGLSYTRYAYRGLKLSAARIAAGEPLHVSVNVRNEGARAGDEVAQLYLSVDGRPGVPLRSLKGFERVHLQPGQTQAVRFRLDARDLAFADEDGVMRIRPATYRIWVGGGQRGSGAPGVATSFVVTGTQALPR